MPDGHVHKLLQFGELDDLRKQAIDLGQGETQQRTVEIDIFYAIEVIMETRSLLKQGSNSTCCLKRSGIRGHHAGQDF